MTTGTVTPHRPTAGPGRESFWPLVHAEWTKFRTVRGWVIAMIVAILVIPAFVLIVSSGGSSCHASGAAGASACPPPPAGPGGEPVNDAFYFVHQPLTGNGTITVQVTSLTGQQSVGPNQMAPGLAPWSKAGIIIKENTSQGSAYAAMMVTGSNGARMQWDYVNDTPGLAGRVSTSAPRWLRLVRVGGTITGYDSADGTHWTMVGSATLPGLTTSVQTGLFAAGTGSENPTVATGVFRHVALSWPASRWTGTNVGGVNGPNANPNGVSLPGTLRQHAGTITVTGYGDISPQLSPMGAWSIQRALDGTAVGLIPLIVVGAMFITAEYRRGLIRVRSEERL